jgi:hypothetical protein
MDLQQFVVDEHTLDDRLGLERAYAAWAEDLLQTPLWSLQQYGKRIPWRLAEIARKHPSMQAAFASPGLYLFGSAAGSPLYLGMTTQTLWKRLSGRYLRGERCQCQLAVTYCEELRRDGINGFPESIREWYRRGFKTSTARLEGAAAFAKHGIEGIWVALLPVHKKELVKPLEARLIPIANKWNKTRGYEPHINKHIYLGNDSVSEL